MCCVGGLVFWWGRWWRSLSFVFGPFAAEETHFLMSADEAFDARNVGFDDLRVRLQMVKKGLTSRMREE